MTDIAQRGYPAPSAVPSPQTRATVPAGSIDGKRIRNMALFLLELQTDTHDREAVDILIDRTADAATAAGGEVLEATVTGDLAQAFVVVSAPDRDVAVAAARGSEAR